MIHFCEVALKGKYPPLFHHPPTTKMGFLSHSGGGSAPHPPRKWESPHTWGVSHVHGGQRPISLEYQFNHPPQVHNTSDTLVTGMTHPTPLPPFPYREPNTAGIEVTPSKLS